MASQSSPASIERWLERHFIAARGAHVRDEEKKKARELSGFMGEVALAVDRTSARRGTFTLIDAAAGHGYVGLLALASVLAPRGRAAALVAIERDLRRAETLCAAATRVLPGVEAERAKLRVGVCAFDLAARDDVLGRVAHAPSLLVALHACGPASDLAIARAIDLGASRVLVAPCCVAASLPAAVRATARADQDGLPRAAEIRRRFVEAWVLAERVLTLESAGYVTEAVPFVAPTTTPYNVVLRGRLAPEPRRIERAQQQLAAIAQLPGSMGSTANGTRPARISSIAARNA